MANTFINVGKPHSARGDVVDIRLGLTADPDSLLAIFYDIEQSVAEDTRSAEDYMLAPSVRIYFH